jgi:hypothetical protein
MASVSTKERVYLQWVTGCRKHIRGLLSAVNTAKIMFILHKA